MAVIKVRNQQRPPDAPAKCIELLRRLLCKVEHPSVERIILEILEETPMKFVRSGLGCERDVPDLRKLSIVVKGGDFQFRDPFRGRIRICPGSAVEDVRCRDTV